MAAKAYNPTSSPVVIDDDGRILPGREHGDVDSTSARVQAAVLAGRLILTDPATQTKVERAASEGVTGTSGLTKAAQ